MSGLSVDAFLDVYDAHCESLLRFFVRRTLLPEVAADLTAETFAVAFAFRGRYDPERGDAGAWLHAIARHQLGSYARRLKVDRRARERLGMPIRETTQDDYERIEALIDFEHIGVQLGAALEQLPPNQRDAVVHRVIEEMSYVRIARLAGCSEQTARARVSRGLRSLAATLSLVEDHVETQKGQS
jgi:RNA polymerase sigma-70 factor (ECF subfamily)